MRHCTITIFKFIIFFVEFLDSIHSVWRVHTIKCWQTNIIVCFGHENHVHNMTTQDFKYLMHF